MLYFKAFFLSRNWFLFLAVPFLCLASHGKTPFQGVVLDAGEITPELVKKWTERNYEVTCKLHASNRILNRDAARKVLKQQGHVSYLIEVARVPGLAKKHPKLMASLQGHPEWRRYFPTAPEPKSDEVIKTFPWVPVLHQEGMEFHLERIGNILSLLPSPKTVWLNNIQGAPSSCGCGNTLCRWTSDYGPKKTTTPIGDEAPGKFLGKLMKAHNGVEFIPIFYPECEEEDQPHFCAGVGCYKGICWKAWSRQLAGISKQTTSVGAASFFKDLNRMDPKYGEAGAWVKVAVTQFQSMPPKSGHKAWPKSGIISVLQGWDVTEQEIKNQITSSQKLGTKGHLLVRTKLDQSWKPMVLKYK